MILSFAEPKTAPVIGGDLSTAELFHHPSLSSFPSVQSSRHNHHSVKPLRAIGNGVRGAERRSNGCGGAAQAGPIARTQVSIVLQLIIPANHSVPRQAQRAVGQSQGM